MTEDELRVLVRQAVARHLGEPQPGGDQVAHAPTAAPGGHVAVLHPSFGRYALAAGDGRCLIEPAVRCNHCGYCQSHGY